MLLNKDGSNSKNLSTIIHDTEDFTLHNDQILPLDYWLKNKAEIKQKLNRIVIWVNSDEDLDSLKEDLPSISLIAFNFPKYGDGRAFSMAHLLRGKYEYKGHIRAIGSPIADQAQFLFRCGVDSIDIPNGQSLEIWTTESKRMSRFYQRSEQNDLIHSRY
ncbi:MAG: DUF934 domain-containing protein [Rhizobiales bacterium]|nr:DUF934 domain-containing protein [Hyphomicrobiales bacterium]